LHLFVLVFRFYRDHIVIAFRCICISLGAGNCAKAGNCP